MYLRIHVPCLACDFICFNGHVTCAQGKRLFKPYQNERVSVKQAGELPKRPYKIDLKISMKMLLDMCYLPAFPSFLTLQSLMFSRNLFPPKLSLVKKKGKNKRGEKGKVKVI